MFKQKFAQNLKQLRKSRKLTQENLAELVGVDFRYISLIENAKSFPSCDLIEKLCSALGVSYNELFDFEEEISRTEIENYIIDVMKNIGDREIKLLHSFAKQLV